MALRFSTKNVVMSGPTTFAHGLIGTADEYVAVPKSGPALSGVWFAGTAADATSLYLNANSSNTVDIFAAVNHSIIK